MMWYLYTHISKGTDFSTTNSHRRHGLHVENPYELKKTRAEHNLLVMIAVLLI